MKKIKLLIGVSIMMVMAFFMLMRTVYSGSEPAAESDKQNFAIAINTFKSSYILGEPIPLAAAVVNASNDRMYIDKALGGIDIIDPDGNALRKTVDTPPSPPPDHYMEIDGETVLVNPVYLLQPMNGIAEIIPDALRSYKQEEFKKKGIYLIVIKTMIVIYDHKSIILRDGFPENKRYWVRRSRPTTRPIAEYKIESNIIKVEIE